MELNFDIILYKRKKYYNVIYEKLVTLHNDFYYEFMS